MEKETKDLIEKILHEIAEDIINKFDKKELKNDIGLLSGKAGISLFMFYYARYFKNERCVRYAQKILENTFDDINNGNLLPTYCSGIAGVCWTIIHLVENNFIEKENLEVLNDFDDYLFKAMQNYIENDDFDFLHGATGIAFYFTKRAETNKKVVEYLEFYVKKLKDYAIFDEVHKTARIISTINKDENKPSKVFNLSLSHGMSSIIIILCMINEKINSNDDILEIVTGMSNFIINHKNQFSTINNSLYPSSLPLNGVLDDKSKISRLGWCYGDIGNGLALFKSAKVNREKVDIYYNNAKEIFLNLDNRLEPRLQSINDAGICHGSAGLICICHSLNEIYSNNIYKNLETHWINITLDYYNKFNGIQGFSKFMNDKYIYDISLLCGTTGVAFSLLKAIDQTKSNWSEMLLI